MFRFTESALCRSRLRPVLAGLLLIALAPLVALSEAAPPWTARHGLTAKQYQGAFGDFIKKGYRLKVVSGYRQGRGDRYAAIWEKTGGPQWSARHGIPGAHVFVNFRYQHW